MRVIDVSVPLRPGMVVYPGDVGFETSVHSAIRDGGGCNNSVLRFGSHTGTHVDAPHHMIDGGPAVDELPLDRLAGPCRVVALPDARVIGGAELAGVDLDGVERVLFKTRSSALWADDSFREDFVAVAADGAERLVNAGIGLVGVDYLSVDPFGGEDHPAHMTLMRGGVVIVEGLDLSAVDPGEYTVVVAPLRVVGGDGAPARVFLLDDQSPPGPAR